MTEIKYGMWAWRENPQDAKTAKLYATAIDPTPQDQVLTEADLKKLTHEQKVRLHQLTTLFEEGITNHYQIPSAPLFDRCRFFSNKPKPPFTIELDPNTRMAPDNLKTIADLLRAIHAIASESPEFRPLVQASCWPAKLEGKVAILLTDNLKTVIKKMDLKIPFSPDADHDAITVAVVKDSRNSEGSVSLFIVVDIAKANTLAKIFAAIAHEFIGHVYQYLNQHPDRFGEPGVKPERMARLRREVGAFQRSVRFLEASIPALRKMGVLTMSQEIEEKGLPKEKKLLAKHQKDLENL